MDNLPLAVCRYCFVEMRAISLKNVTEHNRNVCTVCGNVWNSVTVIQDPKRREYVQARFMSSDSILSLCPTFQSCKNAHCPFAHNHLELEFWKNQKMFSELPPARLPPPNSNFYPTPIPHNSFPLMNPRPHPPTIYPPIRDVPPIPPSQPPRHSNIFHPVNTPQLPPNPQHYMNHGPSPIGPRVRYPHPTLPQPGILPPPRFHTSKHQLRINPAYPQQQRSPTHNLSHRFQTHKNSRANKPVVANQTERSDCDAYYESVIKSLELTPNEPQSNSFFVQPISIQPLEVKIELSKCPELLEWTFLVASDSEDLEVVMGVVMETNYGNNFRICRGMYRDKLTEGYKPITTIPERRSSVLVLKKAINKDCSLKIPIEFKVALGDFKAKLIFDFSHQKIVKRFHILVHREHHDLKPSQDVQDRFEKYVKQQKRDSLLWDKDYEVKYFEHPYLKSDYAEIFTSKIPVNLDEMIKDEKYRTVFSEELTHKNYKRIFEMLLYLEEYECRNIFLSYDLKDLPITKKLVCRQLDKYEKGQGGVEFAPKGLGFIKLEMTSSLFEGFHFLRPPNIALLKPKAPWNVVYYCPSVEQGHDYTWIAVSDELVEECEKYGGTVDIRFKESSIDFHFTMMHQALQNIDPRIIFPCSKNKNNPFQIKIRQSFWENSNLTASQREAITAALDNGSQDVPTVISGPFGCGKTWTLANLAYLLGSQSDQSRILVCCKNNAPANMYINDIHFLSQQHGYNFDIANDAGLKLLFRLFTPARGVFGAYSEIAKKYAKLNADFYGIIPEEKDLHVCRIIVTTVFACPFLVRMDLPRDFFSHIILDEAAQISEPELGIPLSLGGTHTKIIIAGDEFQVTPKLTSPISQKFGLELSLLERLSSHPIYKTQPYSSSLIYLKENYRSDPAIVHLLSELYYSRSLVGMRLHREVVHNDVKPLMFHGVIGKEERIRDSPSYMNVMEAEEIVHIVQDLMKVFQLKDFGVLSTYLGQIWLIREKLRRARLGSVEVVNFEGIQGKEYKVLIVDTVRTLSEAEYATADSLSLGLLEEPKQLNTVLGRAKDHVIVVGNPYTLCEVGKNKKAWQRYMSECINLGSFYIGGKQMFQFNSIPNEIRISSLSNGVASNDCENNPSGKPDLKQRALDLIREREKSLQELLTLSQQSPETRPDLEKHFEKEKELILQRFPPKQNIEEKVPTYELNDFDSLDLIGDW